MKRFLSMLLATLVLAASLPVCSLAAGLPFKDIPENAWYRNAVTQAYEDGLFKGVSDTEFDPEGTMTRAMFVTVLANMTSDYDETKYQGKPAFDDVNADDWFAAPINWAIEHELTEGVGDNLFDPNGKVTREQMAVFMFKYAKVAGNDTSFTEGAADKFADSATVSNWAKDAVNWAVTHGVIAGDDDNRLNPINDAQRCEVAQVVINALPVMENTSLDTRPEPTPEIPSGGGGGGGGGTVTPPEPTPTPTPEPVLDDVVVPQDIEISEIPDGAIQYADFSSLFKNEYRIVPDDDSDWAPALKVNLSKDLLSEQAKSIQSLGEDLGKAYYTNLAHKYINLFKSSLGANTSLRNYQRIKIIFMGPGDVYALTSIEFEVPNISVESYDGIPDELYVDEESETSWQNWSNVYFNVCKTRETIPSILQNGGIAYEDFKNLFSNRSELERNYEGRIVGINLYPSEPLSREQYIYLGKLGSSVLRLYCEQQVEELVEQNVFDLTRDELYSFSIYYYPSKEDAEKGYSVVQAFRLDYVPHPEDYLDYQPGWAGGNTVLWWESEMSHWFDIYDPENKTERFSPEFIDLPEVSDGELSYEEFQNCLESPEIDESLRESHHIVEIDLKWKNSYNQEIEKMIEATNENTLNIYCINTLVDIINEHPDWIRELADVRCSLFHNPISFSIIYDFTVQTKDQLSNLT